VQDWLWKGRGNKDGKITATVDALFERPNGRLRYAVSFRSEQGRFRLSDERIEDENHNADVQAKPLFIYRFENGNPIIAARNKELKLNPEQVDLNASILAQRSDPDTYPELTYIAQNLRKIKLYRDWKFGMHSPARFLQATDMPGQILNSNCDNLYMTLNRIRMDSKAKLRLLKELKRFYMGLVDYDLSIVGNSVQIVFFERGLDCPVPANRLSDGVLRYLSILAIMLNPIMPPLTCIDKPELGMHPDVLPALAELMKEASERSQLIVTTHSQTIVDALSDSPESVLVCEKTENGTQLARLDENELKPWLEKYTLGELWSRGDIGGNRY
jgi:predicted ATPase